MSNTKLSPARLKAIRKAIKGHKEELIKRSGYSRQTVDITLNGYYLREGIKIRYSNAKVIRVVIEILEREKANAKELEEKFKQIT